MRLVTPLALLIVTACFAAAAPAAPPPHSAAILLRVHPAAWQPPASFAPGAPGMRFEPETGENAPPAWQAKPGTRAAALANVVVRTAADGSQVAVLAGAIRAYTVVHLDERGNLVEECVNSEADAIRRVNAPVPPASGDAGKSGGH